MGRETLEPQELLEVEDLERSRERALRTRVAVTAAILAVLASLSALQAERTAAESILSKNEAVLAQSRASDEWAYRQAKSIKLHLQELAPGGPTDVERQRADIAASERSEEHTSELQSRGHLVCRLLLEKKKKKSFPAHNGRENRAPSWTQTPCPHARAHT